MFRDRLLPILFMLVILPFLAGQAESQIRLGAFGFAEEKREHFIYRDEWKDMRKRKVADATWHAWLAKIAYLQDMPAKARLKKLNAVTNASVRRGEDFELYKRRDYWATPTETLRQGGDCEDYAILKYYSLKALGFAGEMRIVFVRDARDINGPGHAVLTARLGDIEYVLDSNTDPVVADYNRIHYRPYVSVNERGSWQHFYLPPLHVRSMFPGAMSKTN